jgi:hypothetical protein
MVNQRGQAQWFWIMISMIIALVVAIFILMIFTDFGAGIKESFDGISGLANPDKVPSPYGELGGTLEDSVGDASGSDSSDPST